MQMMPVVGCVTGAVVAFLVIGVIGPPLEYLTTDRYNIPAQGIVLIITVAGSVGCLAACLVIPRLTRRLSSRGRAVQVLKRMNLLGLVSLKTEQCVASFEYIQMADMAYAHTLYALSNA